MKKEGRIILCSLLVFSLIIINFAGVTTAFSQMYCSGSGNYACGGIPPPGYQYCLSWCLAETCSQICSAAPEGGDRDGCLSSCALATNTNSCPTGQTPCSGICVNEKSDTKNCGSCGNACASGQTCKNSACTSPSRCSSGQTACSPGACVDLTSDSSNCGRCFHPCDSGQICKSSVCTSQSQSCTSGQTSCSGTGGTSKCVDAASDVKNCGGCGIVCALGQTCKNGVCTSPVCSSPTPDTCPGTGGTSKCVNKKTDSSNCGACGNACFSEQTCKDSACSCPTDKPTPCSGTGGTGKCVDTTSDVKNCGGCGTVCDTAAGYDCIQGICKNCDYDKDGSKSLDCGGKDCNDGSSGQDFRCVTETVDCSNPRYAACAKCINPGVKEDNGKKCSDSIDNDCSGKVDCADSSCDGQVCNLDGSGVCTNGLCLKADFAFLEIDPDYLNGLPPNYSDGLPVNREAYVTPQWLPKGVGWGQDCTQDSECAKFPDADLKCKMYGSKSGICCFSSDTAAHFINTPSGIHVCSPSDDPSTDAEKRAEYLKKYTPQPYLVVSPYDKLKCSASFVGTTLINGLSPDQIQQIETKEITVQFSLSTGGGSTPTQCKPAGFNLDGNLLAVSYSCNNIFKSTGDDSRGNIVTCKASVNNGIPATSFADVVVAKYLYIITYTDDAGDAGLLGLGIQNRIYSPISYITSQYNNYVSLSEVNMRTSLAGKPIYYTPAESAEFSNAPAIPAIDRGVDGDTWIKNHVPSSLYNEEQDDKIIVAVSPGTIQGILEKISLVGFIDPQLSTVTSVTGTIAALAASSGFVEKQGDLVIFLIPNGIRELWHIVFKDDNLAFWMGHASREAPLCDELSLGMWAAERDKSGCPNPFPNCCLGKTSNDKTSDGCSMSIANGLLHAKLKGCWGMPYALNKTTQMENSPPAPPYGPLNSIMGAGDVYPNEAKCPLKNC